MGSVPPYTHRPKIDHVDQLGSGKAVVAMSTPAVVAEWSSLWEEAKKDAAPPESKPLD